jgi:hypothetical protein
MVNDFESKKNGWKEEAMKSNKKARIIGLGIIVLVFSLMLPVTGLAVPGVINYQGYLTDAGGNPLNGEVAITFRIWNAPTAGTQLWSEAHAAVTVTEGVFNVVLGSSVPITVAMLDGDRYLGMTVGTDPEMSPRLRMASSPFAIKAADADALGGLPSSEFAPSAHRHSWGSILDIPADFADGVDNTGITVESDPTVPGWIKDGVSWGELSGIPAGFSDGTDNTGITVESDPTVPGWIKDGLSWSELSGIPAGFSDGVDNTGITTETDPEVGSNSVNYIPKWNGTALVAGAIYDNGNIGIGTYTPDQKLHVKGIAHFDVGTGHIHISTPGGWPGIIAYSNNGNRRDIQFYDDVMTLAVSESELAPPNTNGITIGENGSLGVGIGHTLPSEKLQVAGNILTSGNIHMPNNSSIYNANGKDVFHTGWRSAFGNYTTINSGYSWGSGEPVSVVAGSTGVFFTKGDASGTPYATTLASINASGRLSCSILEITGGSDIAEPFEVQESAHIKPGMVMAIDSENPGKLKISDRAYDRRVAGVVSGAGGVNPGMLMQQKDSPAAGATPIALTGRVYCWSDASHGRIEPGDLLTSSETPGHAMKVTDYARAQGAILGKAMSTLEKDKGLVLVLVTLQ